MIVFVLGLSLTYVLSVARQDRALAQPESAVKVAKLAVLRQLPVTMTWLFGPLAAFILVQEAGLSGAWGWAAGVGVLIAFRLVSLLMWFAAVGRARSQVPDWPVAHAAASELVRAVVFGEVMSYVGLGLLGFLLTDGVGARVLVPTVVGFTVLEVALTKFLVLNTSPTRSLRSSEQLRVDRVSEAFGLGVHRGRVVIGGAGRTTNAYQVGFGGRGHVVLLTEKLLETFDDAALSAVLAHEMGHARRWHVARRTAWEVTISTCFVIGLLLLLDRDPADLGFAICLVLVLLLPWARPLAFGGMRKRQELEADRFALSRVGVAPMNAMLEALARLTPGAMERSWWQTLQTGHPDLLTRQWQVSPRPSISQLSR